VLTVFERIPDLFVQVYDYQFRVWAREFRRRGTRCAIVFTPIPGRPVPLDVEGRPVKVGAWLECEVEANRFVVRPASEHDAEMIARHCREIRGHVLQ
jgi:hypothetical protein